MLNNSKKQTKVPSEENVINNNIHSKAKSISDLKRIKVNPKLVTIHKKEGKFKGYQHSTIDQVIEYLGYDEAIKKAYEFSQMVDFKNCELVKSCRKIFGQIPIPKVEPLEEIKDTPNKPPQPISEPPPEAVPVQRQKINLTKTVIKIGSAIENEKRLKKLKVTEINEDTPKFVKIANYILNRYELRYNTISNEFESKAKKPKYDYEKEFRPLNENDFICELLEMGFKAVEKPLIALLKSSYIPKYNPFKQYVHDLEAWDGKTDYIDQLANYVKAKNQIWFNSQFKKMLVRSLACSLGVIPFNKQCFTLVGKQNDGKTSFLRFLVPEKLKGFIAENIDFHSKDGEFSLCQNLFINLDELANFSRYDINKAKSFFTRETVKQRVPFDRKPSVFTRTASFLASTNDHEFLTDVTGNVRFLIFEIDGVKHDNGGKRGYNQNVCIDKVYAQAYTLLKSGFNFRMTSKETVYSEKINRQFQISTPETDLISEYFAPSTKSKGIFYTAKDITDYLSEKTNIRISYVRIGKALIALGFKKVQVYVKELKHQRKGYYIDKLK